ncbi:MAG: hypothetical protein ACR2MG_10390 [Pyrinomonadaceae bacterium]
MNKHIIGFILFSLIVGTSAVFASFFYETPKIDSINVSETPVAYTGRSCWKSTKNYRSGLASVKISQAVFKLDTKELATDLSVTPGDESIKNVRLALHFFVKDGYSTRYLATENLTNKNGDMKGLYDLNEDKFIKTTFSITSTYKLFRNLRSYENLYIIPQIITERDSFTDYAPPQFDETNATPVTVAH